MKEKQTLLDITSNTLNRTRVVLEKERPDVARVWGLRVFFCNCAVVLLSSDFCSHVEAGLRTYNIYPLYPEEYSNVRALYSI